MVVGDAVRIGLAAQRVSRATGLDRVAGAAAGSGRALVGVAAAARATVTPIAAAGAAGLLIHRFAGAADTLAKTSDRLGIGIEALQRLRYAGDLAGVSTQTMDMALQRFTRRTAEAAAGSGEAQGALEYLGIQLTDSAGRMRPTTALLEDMADAMSRVEDESVQVALAGAGAAWIGGLWDGVAERWDALTAWLDAAVSRLLEWLPEWMRERLGLDGPGGGVPAAPERRAGASVLAAGGRTRVGGEVRIRIEGAPPGTRIERVRTDNPEVPIDVEAGYAMAGA